MALGEHVFLYCERGTNEALLAEPINAASNVGFLLAALVALVLLLRRPKHERSADQFLFIGLVLLIGLGSLSFHLFADRGSELADIVPIGVFMLVYLGFALNRFLAVPPGWTVLLTIGFAATAAIVMQVKCWPGAVGFPGSEVTGAAQCLNGSVGYLPALIALIVVGMAMRERGHRAAPYVVWVAAIFAVSITLRSLDLALCDKILIEGRKVGTHAAWHILNALTLFLLLMASLEIGPAAVRATESRKVEPPAPVEPEPEPAEPIPPAKVPEPEPDLESHAEAAKPSPHAKEESAQAAEPISEEAPRAPEPASAPS